MSNTPTTAPLKEGWTEVFAIASAAGVPLHDVERGHCFFFATEEAAQRSLQHNTTETEFFPKDATIVKWPVHVPA